MSAILQLQEELKIAIEKLSLSHLTGELEELDNIDEVYFNLYTQLKDMYLDINRDNSILYSLVNEKSELLFASP